MKRKPLPKNQRGALAKLTRQSHHTVLGSLAITLRLWRDDASLSKSERAGLVNILFLTSASHFEEFLILLVKYRLTFPLMVLDGKPVLPSKQVRSFKSTASTQCKPLLETKDPTSEQVHEVSFEEEQRMIVRIIDEWMDDLEGSGFADLLRRFEQVAGRRFQDIVGLETAQAINALFVMRNLVAHGRDAFIAIDTETFEPRQGEKPLGAVVQCLREQQIIKLTERTRPNAPEIVDQVFSLKTGAYFYRAVRSAEQELMSLPHFQKPTFGFPPHILPELPPLASNP